MWKNTYEEGLKPWKRFCNAGKFSVKALKGVSPPTPPRYLHHLQKTSGIVVWGFSSRGEILVWG
jgi:hypothetical protein